jgi:hypothetical protein
MPRGRGKSKFPGNGVPTPGGAAPGGPREHSANVPPAHSLDDFSPSDVSTHLMSLLGVNGDEHRQPNQSAFIRGVFTPESAAEESMRRQGEVANAVPEYYLRPLDTMFGPGPVPNTPVTTYQRQTHLMPGASVPLSGLEAPRMFLQPLPGLMHEAPGWTSSRLAPDSTPAAPRFAHSVPMSSSPSPSLGTSAAPPADFQSATGTAYRPVRSRPAIHRRFRCACLRTLCPPHTHTHTHTQTDSPPSPAVPCTIISPQPPPAPTPRSSLAVCPCGVLLWCVAARRAGRVAYQ